MYVTDSETQKSKLINNDKYTHSQFLFGTTEFVYNIDKDGTLYGTKVSDGSWKQLSEFGNYNSAFGVTCGENLITVGAKSGRPFLTNPQGETSKINDMDYSKTRFMFGGAHNFYTIENNNLYSTNPLSGECKKIGDTGAYADTKTGAGMNDKIFTLETTGVIWETDCETGIYTKLMYPLKKVW